MQVLRLNLKGAVRAKCSTVEINLNGGRLRMSILEIIHGRVLQRLDTLQDLNFYIYYSTVVFGNCVQQGETLPIKNVDVKPSIEQQLDQFEALAEKSQKFQKSQIGKEPEQLSFDPLQDWVESTRANISREGVRIKRLQAQYRVMSTPIMAAESCSLAEFESHVKASNILDQLDAVYNAMSRIADEIPEKFPDFRNALNTMQQAPMTMDYITIDDDVSSVDPRELQIAVPSIGLRLKEFLRMSYTETAKAIMNKFNHIEVTFPAPEVSTEDICTICPNSSKMIMDPFNSEMVCQKCGATSKLDGVVFEDSQLYSQQSSASKHKNYKYNSHCEKWLNQIQARENREIPQEVIDGVNRLAKRDYTHGGRLRSMKEMRCSEIRVWLKQLGATKFNNNAALIRRLVTAMNGEAVIPPQLTIEETFDILYDFSRAMDLYDGFDAERDVLAEIGKTEVGNKPYYPYGLMKILMNRLPAGRRLNKLIECIHLQTEATLKKHDKLWSQICERIPDFKYVPTNRTVLSCMIK